MGWEEGDGRRGDEWKGRRDGKREMGGGEMSGKGEGMGRGRWEEGR